MTIARPPWLSFSSPDFHNAARVRSVSHVTCTQTTEIVGHPLTRRSNWTSGGLDVADMRARRGASEIPLGSVLQHMTRFEDNMSAEWMHDRAQLTPWDEIYLDSETG